MASVLDGDSAAGIQRVRNRFDDPIAKAELYLRRNARSLVSYTSSGAIVRENFAQILILEQTHDSQLISYVSYPRLANFFQGDGMLTTKFFPCDVDTTSIYMTVADDYDIAIAHSVLDEMLTYRNSNGIIQVYFDHDRPRTDPVVCLNVLTAFYYFGRGSDPRIEATLEWVHDTLSDRTFANGTRYYATAETFLYFFSRFLACAKDLRDRFSDLLRDRLMERIGCKGDPLALAMRILACASVGIINEVDGRTLRAMQHAEGHWGPGWFYRYGSSGILIANDGLTTAFAINALRVLRDSMDVP
ncbi:hypothetical protein GLOTRDRAFT_50143 [Gloeophyllum trabeum ATCC 11539]|uniref:Uncharacterized protein n=1 Tax=Gloeophyllum trabeum (strain ATCC 11539 / FP-39264 / Madison 617) TaxID=670483 RepID=S7R8I2_GLOTA|nr:uncharacterized protein GLOTRDRAFT_50143 [Gloeophyllum trabeum ATCC 11539]EPQ50630.1 hypothetical protein GLOTRDRAFT_50143 [Gloeophyllum trabeum ATCC 11539]